MTRRSRGNLQGSAKCLPKKKKEKQKNHVKPCHRHESLVLYGREVRAELRFSPRGFFTWTVAPDPLSDKHFAIVEDHDAETDLDNLGNCGIGHTVVRWWAVLKASDVVRCVYMCAFGKKKIGVKNKQKEVDYARGSAFIRLARGHYTEGHLLCIVFICVDDGRWDQFVYLPFIHPLDAMTFLSLCFYFSQFPWSRRVISHLLFLRRLGTRRKQRTQIMLLNHLGQG